VLNVFAFLIVVFLVALFLRIDIVVYLTIIVAIILALTYKKPEEKKVAEKAAPREVIYPVIYEDAGEPPYLYPKKQQIKVRPNQIDDVEWEKTVAMPGRILASIMGFFTGKYKKK